MKAVVSVSLGLIFVGLATLNVITILESSRSGQAPRSRARAIAFHRAGGYVFIGLFALMVWFMIKRLIGSPEGISPDAAVHVDLAVLLVPLMFRKGNHRAQVQKRTLDFDAAWIVYLCRLWRARTHPCTPLRIGKNHCFKFDCEVLAGAYCLVLRVDGPFSTTPASFLADENSNRFNVYSTVIETALRLFLPRTCPQRSADARCQDALFSRSRW